MKASEVEKHLKLCLYARNKVGKTVFSCSSDLPTLIIDFNEHGFDSVTHRTNVDIFNCPTWEDVDPIYWYLRGGKHPYKVIVLDTMTMLAAIGMKWVLKDDLERDMTRDPLTPARNSYLKLNEMMKDAIIKFRNLPYHVIFNVQEKTSTEDDEEGNTTIETHPELSPGSRSTLLSATNLVGRLYVAKATKKVGGKTINIMERRMLLEPHPRYVAGSRFKQLKKIERNPNLQDFIDRIYGGA